MQYYMPEKCGNELKQMHIGSEKGKYSQLPLIAVFQKIILVERD
jgi:hypothetical protein